MAIKDDADFEQKLDQLCRLYRAMREIWGNTNASDEGGIAQWVVTGGKVLEKLTEVLADIEDHAGCGELRILVEELKGIRQQRAGQKQGGPE